MEDLSVVILAAGQGTRMKSSVPKVLHRIAGRPMIHWVLDAAEGLSPGRIVVVVGHGGHEVTKEVSGRASVVWQAEQKGTGHAVLTARDAVGASCRDILILCGDTPLLETSVLQDLVTTHRARGNHLSFYSFMLDEPARYGRVVRSTDGSVERIAEYKDLTTVEREIKEVNSGVYVARLPFVWGLLEEVGDDNAAGEMYLTDIVALARKKGLKVEALVARDARCFLGVNDRTELAAAETVARHKILTELGLSGVTVVDPASTYVDYGVSVGPDTVIYPFTFLRGRTVIGAGCSIGPGTEVVDSTVEDGTTIRFSVVESSRIGPMVTVGPFSHIRPGTVLETGARVGNFAEVKNSRVGAGSKIPHHSYVGDATVGEGVNLGAGTVIVNFDGKQKHRTVIEDRAFIGCNSNLVAPVTIGKGAYVAAGSTITEDVPEDSLAIARERQVVKEGWVKRRNR